MDDQKVFEKLQLQKATGEKDYMGCQTGLGAADITFIYRRGAKNGN